MARLTVALLASLAIAACSGVISPETAACSADVPIVSTANVDLGTVNMQDHQVSATVGPATAGPGLEFVSIRVRYEANIEWPQSPLDWSLHDDEQGQFQPRGFAPDPHLSGGVMPRDHTKEGWITFEVPADAAHLWADFRISGRGVIVCSSPLF